MGKIYTGIFEVKIVGDSASEAREILFEALSELKVNKLPGGHKVDWDNIVVRKKTVSVTEEES